jgi:hypothetical protein
VSGQHGDGSVIGHAYVERAYHAIDARCSDDGVAVLVPVVGECFRRRDTDGRRSPHPRFWWGMYRYVHCEVVARTRGRPQIEDAHMAIGAYAAQYTGTVWTECGGIGTRVCGQRCYTRACIRVPNLDRAIPTTRQESVFGDEVPVHSEDFARVFLP